MEIQVRIGSIRPHSFTSRPQNPPHSPPIRPVCSKKDSQQDGDKYSTDWDKAWSSFKKQGKKTLFSQFNPNKYVSWNPKPSDYPLSEEVDPIKRTERSNLMLWTSPKFTLFGAIIIVTFLLVYTILSPVKSQMWQKGLNSFQKKFHENLPVETRILMASRNGPAELLNSEKARLPPKRGQIKRKMVSEIVVLVTKMKPKTGSLSSNTKVTSVETQPPQQHDSKHEQHCL